MPSRIMKKRKYDFVKQPLLPGFESGRFEPRRSFDHVDFASSLEEFKKRDTRVSLRISGEDLQILQRQALAEGLPTQTLLARIIHEYVHGEPAPAEASGPEEPEAAPASVGRRRGKPFSPPKA